MGPDRSGNIHRDVVGPDLTTAELYGLLRLRSEVFVVEQDCVYPDLDGRDLLASTRHLWVEGEGAVVSAVRVLAGPSDDGTGSVLGRVVTAPAWRSRGLAAGLVRAALATMSAPVRIHAQAHLAEWYAQFGFVLDGPEFVEDGIPHVPMVNATTASAPVAGR